MARFSAEVVFLNGQTRTILYTEFHLLETMLRFVDSGGATARVVVVPVAAIQSVDIQEVQIQ